MKFGGLIGRDVKTILKAATCLLVLSTVCAYIAKPASQRYPDTARSPMMTKDVVHPVYFWDSSTDLCFAFITSQNWYGNVNSIASVPCTDAVKKVINYGN